MTVSTGSLLLQLVVLSGEATAALKSQSIEEHLIVGEVSFRQSPNLK